MHSKVVSSKSTSSSSPCIGLSLFPSIDLDPGRSALPPHDMRMVLNSASRVLRHVVTGCPLLCLPWEVPIKGFAHDIGLVPVQGMSNPPPYLRSLIWCQKLHGTLAINRPFPSCLLPLFQNECG